MAVVEAQRRDARVNDWAGDGALFWTVLFFGGLAWVAISFLGETVADWWRASATWWRSRRGHGG
jgi:hypothetical protein